LPTVRLLFAIFLAISSAIAETPRLAELPSDAALHKAPAETGASSAPSTVIEPTTIEPTTVELTTVQSTSAYVHPAASLPDAPIPPKDKVIDKKFIAVMGALGGAETLRFTTHKLVLDHEFAAGAPWVPSVPPNQHLVAKYAAIYAAEVLVTYELKKPHSWLPGDKVIRKLWWAYPATMAPIHIKNGIRSIRTQAPSGCPFAECEEQ
jgi:hypothetical protein